MWWVWLIGFLLLLSLGAVWLLHIRAVALRRQALKTAGAAATRRLVASGGPIVTQYLAFKKANPTKPFPVKYIDPRSLNPGGRLEILRASLYVGERLVATSDPGPSSGPNPWEHKPPVTMELLVGKYRESNRDVPAFQFADAVTVPGGKKPGTAVLIIRAE
jgi:hypothetical protein